METTTLNGDDYTIGYNDPGNAEREQQDYPENGNESQTGAASDTDPVQGYDDVNLDGDDDLAGTDDEVAEDESANDADGNGGYPDAAHTAKTSDNESK